MNFFFRNLCQSEQSSVKPTFFQIVGFLKLIERGNLKNFITLRIIQKHIILACSLNFNLVFEIRLNMSINMAVSFSRKTLVLGSLRLQPVVNHLFGHLEPKILPRVFFGTLIVRNFVVTKVVK